MSGLLDALAVTAFGLACTGVGVVLGRWSIRRGDPPAPTPAVPPDLDRVIEARASRWATERGTPEAAGLAGRLARAGFETAREVAGRPRRRMRWPWTRS